MEMEIEIKVSEVGFKNGMYYITVSNFLNNQFVNDEEIYFKAYNIYEAKEKRDGIISALKEMLELSKGFMKRNTEEELKFEEEYKEFESKINNINII